MDKEKEWIEENTEYPEWVQCVNDRFHELCKMQGYDLNKMEVTSTVIKKHTNTGIDDGIIMFAMETMDSEDFDYTFEPYHVIQINYTGTKKTLDDVHTLTVVDSSFKQFYSHYRFNMTKTFPASVNYAAHKILNYFKEWYMLYIGELS